MYAYLDHVHASESPLIRALARAALDRKAEGDYRGAAEMYAVVADAAEQSTDPLERDRAHSARVEARKALAVDWARRRWPDDGITSNDIVTSIVTNPSAGEIRRFILQVPSLSTVRTFIEVAVGRKGRVRVTGRL